MTIPPSAPPVLAEEPGQQAEVIRILTLTVNSLSDWRAAVAIALGLHEDDADDATDVITALLAQARQGREDAERLREERNQAYRVCDLLHADTAQRDARIDQLERAYSDAAQRHNSANSYRENVEGLPQETLPRLPLWIAATPSPSPEGASE